MKKIMIGVFGWFFLLAMSTAYADVGKLTWSGKTSWTYNNEIKGDKPGDQWDSQLTDQVMNPVKFVLHKSGGNPVIFLRLDDTGSTADPTKIESDLRTRFEARGISVNAVQKKEIGGRNVYIISGLDKAKGFRYSSAVFPRSGTKRAYHIELSAPTDEFSVYEPAFMGMVSTVRLLPVMAGD